jgi:hypothetical protein
MDSCVFKAVITADAAYRLFNHEITPRWIMSFIAQLPDQVEWVSTEETQDSRSCKT